ncbi:GAF domain-containing protein [Sulfitobacter sp. S223]|uniref:HWE histidine kinase domain-containing protein n=1 Tax=Sulfitobacter sp. S223 TaxID=2867023 RepID=UPI0021A83CF3|nr:HWE histidine kinase domain-containing protein [Sulfitobacter sp. S223]UWR27822.1 GAF domain-containing protein [Sulfitobacter sp. S223]
MTEEQNYIRPDEAVDLTNCDREPIHLLGGVQGYGCLIATSSDFMVKHVSQNVQDILHFSAEDAIGGRLIDLLPERTVHDLRTKLQILNVETSSSRLFGYDVLGDGRLFDVSVHTLDQTYVFEFEPKIDTENRDEMSLVQPLVARVRRAKDIKAACDQAAMAVQVMSGFDRVMVYQFDEDGTGEVIAEKRKSSMEPFLGLRYPASDIPKQARALYLRSTLRLISDVDGVVSPIVPPTNVQGIPMDLSMSVMRAVSPIHLEYLRNMGVSASMSVSIIKDGKLWGLFACHHETPRHIDFERRTAIELFAQFFSYELVQKIDIASRVQSSEARKLHDNLMIQLSGGTNLINGFEIIADELRGLIANDGVAVYSDGRYACLGDAPDEIEFKKLVRFLNTAPTGQVFATHRLPALYPEASDFSADIAGVLAVPISRTPRDYIVFFRREVAQSVKWAGNPNKPVEVGPNGTRLTPRKSFDTWSELVRNTSAHWTGSEVQTGESLRLSLIEIVLKLTDESNETRQKAADKQELLIAELNHRVRNILNLIQGLVSQSRTGAKDVATYTKVLDGRVQALARAHDQLTRQEWSPSSLRQLIEVEVNAFLTDAKDRISITGDAPKLMPEAFSTMALVIHEMVTNAAKYGALTDHSGKILLNLRIQDDGALQIEWREIGGPPVQAPSRQGFGTTIIEKTIPYELKGTVKTRYLVTGFEADIMIPSTAVSDTQEVVADKTMSVADNKEKRSIKLSGDVLIVEDNMLIALDASDILKDNGADDVHMSGSVADALAVLEANTITFALLDVNLGDQTSLPIAQVLADRSIPFVLATGYGDAESITASYPPAVIAKKPFTAESIVKAISSALSSPDN